jgi:hypothetical protein
MSSTDNKKKINYIGSVWHNEYEGEFSGYSLYLTSEDLKYAQKFLGETDRVQIKLRPGRDDAKKPYGSIETAKTAAPPKTEQAQGNSGYSRVTPSTTLEF